MAEPGPLEGELDEGVARVRMVDQHQVAEAVGRTVRSRGLRRASGRVVVQPTFVKVALVSTTTRPEQDGLESLIFVNLSLLACSLNL